MRSNLELHGPRIGLNIGPRSSRMACSAPLSAQNPNLLTNVWIDGVRGREIANSQAPFQNPALRTPRNSWALAHESPVSCFEKPEAL
eukprot:7175416-Alexandrium_andersonii.AAC.1